MNDSEVFELQQQELEFENMAKRSVRVSGVPYEVEMPVSDPVNHPSHYTSHPSGIEAIQVTEHMNFCIGNAVKYLWRADEKHDDGGIEDLKKAVWYIQRELQRRTDGKHN